MLGILHERTKIAIAKTKKNMQRTVRRANKRVKTL